MFPTADHIYDTTSTFTERTTPLHPRRHSDRAQTARMDAVAARILAGYKARWHHLAGAAALSSARWPPSSLPSFTCCETRGTGLDGRVPFFRKEHQV